ncbi:MAG: hypothetical protein QOE63_779 [Acidimicrobiaceae bacterium]
MGKASSAKKVARAARAGGSRRSGQRRALGFPIAIFVVVALGLSLVLVARGERITNAEPKVGDHIHAAYSTYTCVPETNPTDGRPTTTSAPAASDASATTAPTDASTTTAPTDASTTTAPTDGSTTTTAAGPSTTIAGEGDVPGQFQPPFKDATTDVLGIHTHGDGVIHTHPFVSSVAGRDATLGKFFEQVSVEVTDTALTLPTGETFTEGLTKCAGGKDGIVEIAQWSSATDAANGARPNAVFTDGFANIHLSNREAFTIAFLPQGEQMGSSARPVKSSIEQPARPAASARPIVSATSSGVST